MLGKRLVELFDNFGADGLEGLHDPLVFDGDGLEGPATTHVKDLVEFLDRGDEKQVPLVVLKNEGHLLVFVAVFPEHLLEILEGLEVVLKAGLVAVGHEDKAVNPVEHHLAGGAIIGLAGNTIDEELGLKPGDIVEINGEVVEEKGAIALGVDGGEVGPVFVWNQGMDVFDVGGLAPKAGADINDFTVNFPCSIIDDWHRVVGPERPGWNPEPKLINQRWWSLIVVLGNIP